MQLYIQIRNDLLKVVLLGMVVFGGLLGYGMYQNHQDYLNAVAAQEAAAKPTIDDLIAADKAANAQQHAQ